ncbi:IclR family transcriptional regulator [Phenylobacterium sp.]|uniref:IclR family transcriptional regulator n=1 Tax=Phenylobacterium sp. TaxID=1871053 RepID=UPI00301BF225
MRPVELALQVLERVAEDQPIGASELARRMQLPKATVHRLLIVLEHCGWLERDGDGRAQWSVTLKPVAVAGRAIERKSGLRMAALPVIDELRRTTDETVHLGVLEGDSVVLMERFDGAKSVNRFLPIGTHWHLHWSSAGRAILANFPPDRQAAYLAQPLLKRRSTEPLEPGELAAELDAVKAQGYAITIGGGEARSSSVGAAIFDKQGFPFAGLSITGAVERLTREKLEALAPQVAAAAHRISMGMSLA